MSTATIEGLLIYSQEEDAYYLFSREAMERARVSAEQRTAIEATAAESNDVSGFYLINGVSANPTAQSVAQQQSANALQNALNSVPQKSSGSGFASLFTGMIGTWPAR
jgi:hypothetical protein